VLLFMASLGRIYTMRAFRLNIRVNNYILGSGGIFSIFT
jgi:hypothetical protein